MRQTEGYAGIYRDITLCDWFRNPLAVQVYTYLILSANYRPSRSGQNLILPGQVIIGRDSVARDLGISPQKVRTALDKLEGEGTIERRATNQYTIVTITNWVIPEQKAEDKKSDNKSNAPKPSKSKKFDFQLNKDQKSVVIDENGLQINNEYRTNIINDICKILNIEDIKRVRELVNKSTERGIANAKAGKINNFTGKKDTYDFWFILNYVDSVISKEMKKFGG